MNARSAIGQEEMASAAGDAVQEVAGKGDITKGVEDMCSAFRVAQEGESAIV